MSSTATLPMAQEEAPVVDVVVPVHNEEGALERSVRRLRDFLDHDLPFPARVVIADNASTDGTWAIAERLERDLRGVRAVHLPGKGRGGALAETWLASDARVVAYMDVDLSTDLDALLPLVAPLLSGHSDIAIGSRLASGSRVVRSPRREVISRGYNLLLRLALRVHFRDAQCGFKAMRADVARRLLPRVENRRWFFDTELLVLAERAGMRIHEVPVDWVEDPDSRVDVVSTAAEDLAGIVRVGRRLLDGRVLDGLSGRLRPPREPATGRQLRGFVVVGVASTIAYGALFWMLRPLVSTVIANAIALVITAVANTAVNRRLTFGVQGRSGLARDHLAGLLALGAALATTNLAVAGLQAADAEPSRAAELAVLVGANLAATLLRFVLLRTVVLGAQRRRAEVVEIPRRRLR